MHGFDMYSFSPFDVGRSLAQSFAFALLQNRLLPLNLLVSRATNCASALVAELRLQGLMADVPVPNSAESSTPEDCDPREDGQRRDAQPRWAEPDRPRRDGADRRSRDERRSRGRAREPEGDQRREHGPEERRAPSGDTGKGSKGGKKGKNKGKSKGKGKERMFSRAEVQNIVAEALDQADARRAPRFDPEDAADRCFAASTRDGSRQSSSIRCGCAPSR